MPKRFSGVYWAEGTFLVARNIVLSRWRGANNISTNPIAGFEGLLPQGQY